MQSLRCNLCFAIFASLPQAYLCQPDPSFEKSVLQMYFYGRQVRTLSASTFGETRGRQRRRYLGRGERRESQQHKRIICCLTYAAPWPPWVPMGSYGCLCVAALGSYALPPWVPTYALPPWVPMRCRPGFLCVAALGFLRTYGFLCSGFLCSGFL